MERNEYAPGRGIFHYHLAMTQEQYATITALADDWHSEAMREVAELVRQVAELADRPRGDDWRYLYEKVGELATGAAEVRHAMYRLAANQEFYEQANLVRKP